MEQRPIQHTFIARAWRSISRQANRSWLIAEVEQFLRAERPSLVLLSHGVILPPIELMELCMEQGWPFALVGHQSPESWWPDDERSRTAPRRTFGSKTIFFYL